MNRVGNLYTELCRFDNLLLVFKKASKAAKSKLETLLYFYKLEQNRMVHLCQYDTWDLRNELLRSFEETPLAMRWVLCG